MGMLDDIEAFLIDAGLAGGDTDCWLAKYHQPPIGPDVPEMCVTLYLAGGTVAKLRAPILGVARFQIRVRGPKNRHAIAIDKIRTIARRLTTTGHRVMGDHKYNWVAPSQTEPTPFGPDANGCPQYGWSFEVGCSF